MATIASLAAAEFVLWALGQPADECTFVSLEFDRNMFCPDPERFWRLAPTAPSLEVNAVGLRGYWPTGPKAEHEYRIVCVGDSCTFGAGVPSEATYALRLANLVRAAMPERLVSSVRLALPGYSTFQSRVLLDQYHATLQPDLVVLYCGTWNDYLPAFRHPDATWARVRAEDARRPRLIRVLRRFGSAPAAPNDLTAVEFERGVLPHGQRVPVPDFVDNMRYMASMARRGGSQVAIVLPPLPPETTRRYPVALEYRAASRRVATEVGAILFDGAAAVDDFLAKLPESWRTRDGATPACFNDWAHPSVVGHAVLARGLFACLQRAAAVRSTTSLATAPSEAPNCQLSQSGIGVTASWDQVPGAMGYLLYGVVWSGEVRKHEPGRDWILEVDAGNARSYEQPLWPGATIELCIQAYNPVGAGPFSQPLRGAVPVGSQTQHGQQR